MSMLKVCDVAEKLEVNPSVLYNWKLKGILIPEYKTPTGRYFYSEEQVEEFKRKMHNSQAVATN